jgi:hypothetical protein
VRTSLLPLAVVPLLLLAAGCGEGSEILSLDEHVEVP